MKDIPIIDSHCHLFDLEYREHNLAEVLSLSLENWDEKELKETLMFKRVVKQLSSLTDKKFDSEQEILEWRQKIMKKDYQAYINKLFEDANISAMIVDLGYKPEGIPLSEFREKIPAKVFYVFRIEMIIDEVWEKSENFAEAKEKFKEEIEHYLNEGIVAIKSIIGYRTGLKISDPDEKEASRAFDNRDEKTFRDFFFRRTIEICEVHNIPFQIHASFGESNINPLNNNPLFLKNIIDENKNRSIKFILVHGGYPYNFEATYLAAMYPQVYLDISQTVPWLKFGGEKMLKEHLDMAPFSKIMFGSDGYTIPEISWFGAHEGRKVVKNVLSELDNILSKEEIQEIKEKILYKNAKKVFDL